MNARTIPRVGFTLVLLSHTALADDPTKQQCIDANTDAQSQRTAGHFSAARKALTMCMLPACPPIVRDDCAQRFDELQRAQPAIVFSVKNGSGQDLVDVTITVDGQPLTQKLDGHPLPVDPGDHTFVFQIPGEEPVTQHFVLDESETNRHETVTIGKVATHPLAASGPTLKAPPPPEDPHKGNAQRIVGLAVAGVGVVGVGIGAIFGLSASSSWSNAQSDCPSSTNCQRDKADGERSSALTSSTVSTIGFIAGGVLVAGGAVLFFAAPKSHASVSVGLTPAPGGALLRGTF